MGFNLGAFAGGVAQGYLSGKLWDDMFAKKGKGITQDTSQNTWADNAGMPASEGGQGNAPRDRQAESGGFAGGKATKGPLMAPFMEGVKAGGITNPYALAVIAGTGDNESGFLIPPRDAEALANAMLKLLETPGFVERFGARSRALALEKFDARSVLARTIALYD